MVEEARLEDTGAGLAPASEGWVVLNVADAAWETSEDFAAACGFEADGVEPWDVGFTLAVLWPGKPSALYHRESNQEDFLVLAGSACCSSRATSARSRRGTSSTAHPRPTTSSSARATGPA